MIHYPDQVLSDVANQAPWPQESALFGSAAARQALCGEADGRVARLLLMMERTRRMVVGDRVQRLALLVAQRVSLAGQLQSYQQFKHGRIFDPVVQHGRPSSKVVARTMKVDCMMLGEQFGSYHARWLGVRPSEWPHYRSDVLAMTDTLSQHLTAELRAMHQLLMISDFYA